MRNSFFLCILCCLYGAATNGQPVFVSTATKSTLVFVDSGWARNTINTVIFRKNAIVSGAGFQFVAFYDAAGWVTLAKRSLRSTVWEIRKTSFRGNVKDAHNTISIMLDGDGYLHISWDHHNNKLHYTKSVAPYSLELMAPMVMTGVAENSVSYPEFHRMPNGDLLFLYRDGASGRGNLVIDRYDLKKRQWVQLHKNLIDGEGKQSAYWQATVDVKGQIHISWVWRSSPDVASNHDLCYAISKDGGSTWQRSDGASYTLPITDAQAERAVLIPTSSELINQTSMQCDAQGRPYIASYWRDKNDSVPQYHIVMQTDKGWKTVVLPFRKTSFSLSGAGTKQISIARPQLLLKQKRTAVQCILLFRDEERGNKASAAISRDASFEYWSLADLNAMDLGNWEPCYDTELWRSKQQLHLYAQRVVQSDGEGLSTTPATPIYLIEWKPRLK